MEQNRTRVVVVGGGYGGVEAAKRLERELGGDRRVEITLIDRNPFHTLMTELHEVAGGPGRAGVGAGELPQDFRRPAGHRRHRHGIRRVDFDGNALLSDSGEYPYDYLVIGAGGEPEDYGIPGIKEHTFRSGRSRTRCASASRSRTLLPRGGAASGTPGAGGSC